MKKGLMRGLGVAAVLGAPAAAMATDDVWSAATTAVTTASTNTTALLIVGIGIPVAMLGYKVVKHVINRV